MCHFEESGPIVMDTLVDGGDDAVVTSSGDRREASESSNDDGISHGSSVVVTSCRKDLDHLSSGNNLSSSSPSSSSSTSIFLPNSLRTPSNSVVGSTNSNHHHHPHHNSNRTVVFTSISPSTASTAIPGTLKHHQQSAQQPLQQQPQSQATVNSHHGMSTQAIAVPQPGGGVSIVQVQLSANQVPNTIQSVIQPAHQQSVIQATGGAAATSLQTLQIPKNVIFLNKVAQNSVIQSTDHQSDMNQVLISGFDRHDNTSPSNLHTGSSDSVITPPPPPSTTTTSTIITPVQQTSTILPSSSITGSTTTTTPEDESKKRREALERRPSYRKILNELSSADVGAITSLPSIKTEDDNDSESSTTTIVTGVSSPYLKVVPGSTIQLATAQDGLQGLQTLNMTNASGGGNTIVQYATQGQDGQFFVPVTVSAAELQAYQIRTGTGSAQGLAQGVVMTAQNTIASPHHPEDATKKRELRLLKNREAAKECRRKKKEYIKCLEQRVNVLENQNKALIEELKTLKNLYCQKE